MKHHNINHGIPHSRGQSLSPAILRLKTKKSQTSSSMHWLSSMSE
jgi:hypothetical protein